MAVDEVALFVGEPPEVVADGSEHITTLAALKHKILHQPENEETSSKLQCPKVPERLRSDVTGSEAYYEPKVMSLGPYHHDKPQLVRGEKIKLKLAATYIQDFGKAGNEQSIDDIYNIISRNIKNLRDCYDAESTKKYSDEEFSVMMLVDGCALLRYILCVCLGGDYEDYNIRYQDLSLIHQDVLLLENQLPYDILLHELMKKIVEPESAANDAWKVMFLEFFGMNDESFFVEFFGIKRMKYSFLRKVKNYFIEINQNINRKWKSKRYKESRPCHHLLDLFRKNFLGDDERFGPTHSEAKSGKKGPGSVRDAKDQVMASFRNVKELMAAGIRIKSSHTRYLRDISFTSNSITACLKLPPITIDNSTKAMFFNLIAYEMSSDMPHNFISYLRFLDSLIDHADDVKELQSAGVLQNNLGTHEEVAQFFNTVSANLESNFHAYKDVRVKIRKHLKSHYKSKVKMWMTQCLDTYFGNPWTIIALIGAVLALFLTAVQTYFSAFRH